METLSDTAGTVPDTDAVVDVPSGKLTVTSAAVVPDGTAGAAVLRFSAHSSVVTDTSVVQSTRVSVPSEGSNLSTVPPVSACNVCVSLDDELVVAASAAPGIEEQAEADRRADAGDRQAAPTART